MLLAREIAEQEQADDEISPRRRTSRGVKVEWVQQQARDLGVGQVIEEAIRLTAELGLKVRPWPKSLTIVPGTGMMKTLLYLGVKEQGLVGVGYSPENITTLYGGDEQQVHARIGPNWQDLTPDELREKLVAFAALMHDLMEPDEEPDNDLP